jgi:hypothetical protein
LHKNSPKAADNNYNDAEAVEESNSVTEVDSAESDEQHLRPGRIKIRLDDGAENTDIVRCALRGQRSRVRVSRKRISQERKALQTYALYELQLIVRVLEIQSRLGCPVHKLHSLASSETTMLKLLTWLKLTDT